MTAAKAPTAANPPAEADSTAWFALSPEDALKKQGVDQAQGLAAADVDSRRAKYGPNKFTAAKRATKAAAKRVVIIGHCTAAAAAGCRTVTQRQKPSGTVSAPRMISSVRNRLRATANPALTAASTRATKASTYGPSL